MGGVEKRTPVLDRCAGGAGKTTEIAEGRPREVRRVDDHGTQRQDLALAGSVVRQNRVRSTARRQEEHETGLRHVEKRARRVGFTGRDEIRLRAGLVPFHRVGTQNVHTARVVGVLRIQRFGLIRHSKSLTEIVAPG